MAADRARGGLTLVELLVTVALMALVAGACAATFAGGLRVWERLAALGARQAWVPVAFDEIRRDLHRVRRFKPIPFAGRYDRVSFPALVAAIGADGVEADEIGQRGYFFDSARRRLCQSAQPYRRLRHDRLTDACSPVLTDVERVRMSYYGVDPDSGVNGWSGSWSGPEPPLAVKIEVTPEARDAETQTLLVQLPAAAAPAPALPAKP